MYKQVKAGDIIWHPYSANIGAIGVVSKCFDQALVAPRYTVIRLKDSIYSPLYVASCLKQPYCLNQINNYAVSSARISFTFNELKNIKIPKPTEQTRQDFQQTAEKLDYHRSQLNILENDLQKIIDQQVSNLNVS